MKCVKICVLVPKVSVVHNFQYFSLKVADTRIIYSVCAVIASRERPGLMALWLACRSMDHPEDHGRFPSGHLFFSVLFSSFKLLNAELLHTGNM